jgi:hypothetical protein
MIEQYAFGGMTVSGRSYRKDLKIIQGRVVENWRRKEGHRLYVQDVKDILAVSPTFLVVGTGYSGGMRVDESLRSALVKHRVELIAEATAEAVNREGCGWTNPYVRHS